ncbi:TlyA family RNA methyltransferase [bacterium]|jgi:23S rRNA (cytidine1920-2'-O)/16S rRNA (cytidine1409-2'-O)-methyltransferase|nr:TlyA family RNA methyltransferase [bacterium]MBT6293906.1 TlyA family RNA methyltransferase [bacterium]
MRLDKYLVENNLVENRSKALNLIRENLVLVNGSKAKKPGQEVKEQDVIEILEYQDFVSRSARKLLYALETFEVIDLQGVGLDVGASTGGFTQVLLNKGLSKVYALDVGDSQLHPKIKEDNRVVDLSPVNARNPYELPEKVDVVTVDVSFISNLKILPNIVPHLNPGNQIFLLFKPQFEGQKADINQSGVVKSQAYQRIFDDYKEKLQSLNFEIINQVDSKVIGKKGNKEKVLQVTYLF